MKKLLAIILASTFALAACGTEEAEQATATPQSAEERIGASLKANDELEFTESNGFAFVRASAVSDKESVAKTKLFYVAKALDGVEEVENATINVVGPTGRLLYKVTIDRAGLDTVDFEGGAGLDAVLVAAKSVKSTY